MCNSKSAHNIKNKRAVTAAHRGLAASRAWAGRTGMTVVKETGESLEEYARAFARPKHPWLIDPRKSRRIGYWDMITSVSVRSP